MILQSLVSYYDKLEEIGKIAKPGWCSAKVSYQIDLDAEGNIRKIVNLKKEETRGKKTYLVPQKLSVPEMAMKTSGVSANFLCCNAKYFLGICQEEDKKNKERTEKCFLAAKEKHLSLLKQAKGDMARAICLFFEKWNPKEAREHPEVRENWEDLTDGGNLIFGIGADFAQDDAEVKKIWNSYRLEENDGVQGTCLVTGEHTEISRVHRKIMGIPGAQSSGASLVSFNEAAFQSDGKEQSFNAPIGKHAEFAYTTALNYLIFNGEYSLQISDTMVVFWAESAETGYQDLFMSCMDSPAENSDELRDLLKELQMGRLINFRGDELDPKEKFYVLGLAPNVARLSVRFFYEDSFGNILHNIFDHYKRMEIIRPKWETKQYLNIREMLYETVNKNSKDKKPVPNMAAMTFRAILSGSKYPERLYSDTLIRIRAEQDVSWKKMAILQMYLIHNRGGKGENYMGLNEENNEIAYVLGRLFSAMEGAQLNANQGVQPTIRDRYFNSACATPAVIFPTLIRLNNYHMKKTGQEKGGARKYYENLITKIMQKVDANKGFPKYLSLEEQGKFALGYYHQTQERYNTEEDK